MLPSTQIGPFKSAAEANRSQGQGVSQITSQDGLISKGTTNLPELVTFSNSETLSHELHDVTNRRPKCKLANNKFSSDLTSQTPPVESSHDYTKFMYIFTQTSFVLLVISTIYYFAQHTVSPTSKILNYGNKLIYVSLSLGKHFFNEIVNSIDLVLELLLWFSAYRLLCKT